MGIFPVPPSVWHRVGITWGDWRTGFCPLCYEIMGKSPSLFELTL